MNVILYPDSRLRKESTNITKFDGSIRHLIILLKRNLGNGVGISAPQVGINKNILLYLDESYHSKIMINPEIVYKSEEENELEEGCLSCPDKIISIKRSNRIVVKYKDEFFMNKEKSFEGIVARIIQHEIDHLKGVLIIDYENRYL